MTPTMKEAFTQCADENGMSLSGWLLHAALAHLRVQDNTAYRELTDVGRKQAETFDYGKGKRHAK